MKDRTKMIVKASWVSVIGNGMLSIMKISIGFISGSLAVIGDGIDTGVDIITSIITLITARIASRPPNVEFAYGYKKADAIAAKILSFIIFFVGVQLAFSAVTKIVSQENTKMPEMLAIYVTIVSIMGKVFLTFYQFQVGKKTKSAMLVANAKNMKNDILISVSVLIGLVITFFFKMPIIDSILSVLVSLWIIKVSFEIFMEVSVELMDGIRDPSLYDKLFKAVQEVKGVFHPHRARIRKLGDMYIIGIDIEVEGSQSVLQAHEIAKEVERNVKKRIKNIYDIIIHIEPLGNIETKEKYGVSEKTIKTILQKEQK